MERRHVFRLIAILFTVWALLDVSAAEARSPRPPRPPRRCHPGATCQHGTGVCNDAGQCCGTSEFVCGTSCCNALPNVGCCDGACVYTDTEENCGSCGNVCHGGKFCTDGVCACRGGETDCNGFCANLLTDNPNCGSCGTQCGAGFSCFLGTCRCANSGQELCNGQCIDVTGDPNNCGACGIACPGGQDCVGGQCQPPCDACQERVNNVCVLIDPAKDTVCNGACVDTTTDSANCGSCGNVCLGGDTCQNGLCIGSACPAPDWRSCGTIGPTTYCALQGTTCCVGARDATGCGAGTKCAANLDAYCCPIDDQICGISAGYPCVPPGSQCPQ